MSNNIGRFAPQILHNYPTPLSPPLPAISKDVELARAMSASSRSSLFALSRSQVVYEDQWLIAVNKPSGIYCEAVLNSVPTLLNTGTPIQELHLANRLDRDTSGVMIITKSHKAAANLVKAFTSHEVKKSYIVLCTGAAPKWRRTTVKSGHGRSKFGAWRVYALSDVGRSLPGGSMVREMETTMELVSVNGKRVREVEEGVEDDVCVVEEKNEMADDMGDELVVRAFPKSGRTHQIRLHCQYLGIPVNGDVKYCGVLEWKGRTYDGHQLHAESVVLKHPVTGTQLLLSSPLPSWASEAFDKMS